MKFIEPLTSSAGSAGRKKRYYQFTAIDDCTRIRVLRIYDRNTQRSSIQFIDYVLAKLPFAVEAARPTTAPSSRVASTGTCSTAGSATTTSSPRPPGSTARLSSPRIDDEEFYQLLDGVVIDDVGFPPFRGGLLIADGAFHLRHPDAIGSFRGRSSDLRGWFHAARSFRAGSVSRSASICS